MKTKFIRAAAVLQLCPLLSYAEIIGVETFDYPDGAIANRDGGTFWDFKNTTTAGHDGTASTWDNVLGSPSVVSSRLSTNETSAKREFNGPTNGFGVGSDEENGSFTDGRVNQVLYIRNHPELQPGEFTYQVFYPGAGSAEELTDRHRWRWQ